MKILYLSDIHFNHWDAKKIDILSELRRKFRSIPKKEKPDVLCVVGDISVGGIHRAYFHLWDMKKFIDIPIVAVLGNHDFYGTNIETEMAKYPSTKEEAFKGDIHLLEYGDSCNIQGQWFVGGTGWIDGSWDNIHLSPIYTHYYNSYSDFRCIQNYQRTFDIGYETRYNIFKTLDRIDSPAVVLTHFIPTRECIHSKYIGNSINPCFSNEWVDYIEANGDKIAVWLFGHGHNPVSKIISGVKFESNPIGYPGENSSINFKMVKI